MRMRLLLEAAAQYACIHCLTTSARLSAQPRDKDLQTGSQSPDPKITRFWLTLGRGVASATMLDKCVLHTVMHENASSLLDAKAMTAQIATDAAARAVTIRVLC